jgi:hypothetical protein
VHFILVQFLTNNTAFFFKKIVKWACAGGGVVYNFYKEGLFQAFLWLAAGRRGTCR